MHGKGIILSNNIDSSTISDQWNISPNYIHTQFSRCSISQVDEIFIFVSPLLTANATTINLQIQSRANNVFNGTQTPIHMGFVPQAPIVLQPPHLIVIASLSVHPYMVFVWFRRWSGSISTQSQDLTDMIGRQLIFQIVNDW